MMKSIRIAVVAAIVGATSLAAMPAQARPHHRGRVCHMERHHGHMVRHCHYR